MKRITALLLIFGLFCGLLSGCGQEEKAYVPTGDALFMEGDDLEAYLGETDEEPQQLSLVYYPDRSMNPLIGTNYTNRALFSLIYQGLFSTNSDYEPVPILCRAFQISPSNMVHTFYLEEDATFSDGSRVLPEDVLATYEAARESEYYGGRFTYIDSISLAEDGGIVFTLTTPYENLPLLLDIPIIKAGELEADFPLGSGPYIFSNSLSGPHLRINLNWWCDVDLPVTAESVPLVKASSPSQIRDEFEFYDVGLVCADPLSDNYADFRCDYELWDVDNGVFLYIGCNILYSDYFKDTDVLRRYLTYAIDRASIVENYYRGYAQASTLAASPSSPYYSTSLAEQYAYDPNTFMNAISNFPKQEEPLTLLVNSDDSARVKTARAIAEHLTDLGLETVTDESSTLVFRAKVEACNYDIYLGMTKLPPNMDLSEFFRPWGELSWGGITSPTLQDLCKEALANHGNYYNLLQKVADDGRIVPILFGCYEIFATRGLLTNLTPARDNIFFYSLGKTMDGIQIATEYN